MCRKIFTGVMKIVAVHGDEVDVSHVILLANACMCAHIPVDDGERHAHTNGQVCACNRRRRARTHIVRESHASAHAHACARAHRSEALRTGARLLVIAWTHTHRGIVRQRKLLDQRMGLMHLPNSSADARLGKPNNVAAANCMNPSVGHKPAVRFQSFG